MNTQEAEEKLKDYLFNGILAELHWAKEARALATIIGNHSAKINSTRFNSLFGRLQVIFSDHETLSVAKIFDRLSKKNPVRSISSTLELLKQNNDLWILRERNFLEDFLKNNGHTSFSGKSDSETSKAVIEVFELNLPSSSKKNSCQLSKSLDTVLESRDKVHAHNEAILVSKRTPVGWSDTKVLIDYAENFVNIISKGFLGLAMIVHNPELTAKRLEQLLAISNLVNEEFKSEQRNIWMVQRLKKQLFKEDYIKTEEL